MHRPLSSPALARVGRVVLLSMAAASSTTMVVRRWSHPAPLGEHHIGSLRGRLPPLRGRDAGLFAQVTYPADPPTAGLDRDGFPYIRTEVVDAIATNYRMPRWLMRVLLAGRRQVDAPGRLKADASGKGWPVIIFSSGLFGCCEMYTQLCRELASAGVIVLAIEHEDGSGMYAVDGVTGEPIPYKRPPPEVQDVVAFRRPFLEERARNLQEVIATIIEAAAAPAAAAEGIPALLHRADPSRILLAGHSFGAAGILHFLRRLDRQPEAHRLLGALLADPWMEPLPAEERCGPLQVPFFALLSETWATVPRHAGPCGKLAASSGAQCLAICSVPGQRHQWISDSHLWLFPWLLRRIGIMGPGNYAQARQGTAHALLAALEALLDRSKAAGLQKRLAAGQFPGVRLLQNINS